METGGGQFRQYPDCDFGANGAPSYVRHFTLRRRRSFFALAPNSDLFPCSGLIGLPEFIGGSLSSQPVEKVLDSAPFRLVTGRKVEDIAGCDTCVIRHFCGAPCPAEAHEMNGSMKQKGAFCRSYKEQFHYTLRLIADGCHQDFPWDDCNEGTATTCAIGSV